MPSLAKNQIQTVENNILNAISTRFGWIANLFLYQDQEISHVQNT